MHDHNFKMQLLLKSIKSCLDIMAREALARAPKERSLVVVPGPNSFIVLPTVIKSGFL